MEEEIGFITKYFPTFEHFLDLYPRITERRATLSMVGVNPRTYFHWKDFGIVGEKTDPGKPRNWVRLNLYDYVWLKTVKVLREFGLPLESIVGLKARLFFNHLDLVNDEMNFDELLAQSDLHADKIKELKRDIQNGLKLLDSIPDEIREVSTFWASTINAFVATKQDVSLIIYKSGEEFLFGIFRNVDAESYKVSTSEWLGKPHINIPLGPLVGEFMEEPKNENNLIAWGFISHQEKKVLDAIRQKDFKEIIIKPQDNDINIDVIKEGNITEEKARQLRRILGLGAYSEITIKYRNEKNLYFRNKKKL